MHGDRALSTSGGWVGHPVAGRTDVAARCGDVIPMCRAYRIRLGALTERARRARSAFLPPEDPPARDRALEYLRDGVAPAIALYSEAAITDDTQPLSTGTVARLDTTLDEWLELYAACYGVHIHVDASVARAADLFEDGQSLREIARTLTGVPGSSDRQGSARSSGVVGPNVPSDRP